MQLALLSTYEKIVILTGAGISVASGLPTYRGPDGVWKTHARLSKAEALHNEPETFWSVFGALRIQALAAQPNPAHLALAQLAQHHPDVTVITQNVDGLHQRAGLTSVLELHGNLFRTRCSNSDCDLPTFADEDGYPNQTPRCPRCGSVLRPDIVLFGEEMPVDPMWRAKRALRDVSLFIAVGTSGTVSPASNFVRSADYEGAITMLINLEPTIQPNPYFKHNIQGRAEEILPTLARLRP